jgi:hypothetical protein
MRAVVVIALVEIGFDNIWALLLAFVLVLAAIAAIAGVILLASKRTSQTFSLPVSKPTFDRVSAAVAKGMERLRGAGARAPRWIPRARPSYASIVGYSPSRAESA